MQRDLHLFRRYVFVAALAMVAGGCNSDPALLAQLSGDAAGRLAEDLDPAEPVLVARAHDNVVAVVFSKERADIAPLLERLLVPEVEGCGSGGWFGRDGWIGREGAVLCCDPATGTFVLNSERGWIRTGERCEPSDADERTANDDPYEPGIKFVRADPDLSQLLEDLFRIDHRFMLSAGKDGTPQALVNGPLPSEEIQLEGPKMQRSGFQRSSPTILASHKKPTPAGGCVWTMSSCSTGGSGRCRKQYWHVYYKDSVTQQWCEFPPTCGC